MNFFDYWTTQPLEELQSAWDRVPHTEYAQFGSLKGRTVCVLKIFCHTASFVIKPVVYLVSGIALVTVQSFVFSIQLQKEKEEVRGNFLYLGVNLILTALVAPCGQMIQIFKATIGVLHPACYFKEDKLHHHFVQLANIAEELDCDAEFVELLKNGSQIVNKNQYFDPSRVYYYALFERDLAMICDKLSGSNLSNDQKVAILDMLAPLPENPDVTGINACSPGLGRILEQICYCLDVPQDPEKMIPWLKALYQIDILNLMALQSDIVAKYWTPMISKEEKERSEEQQELPMGASHFSNLLIFTLGNQIGLPKEMIESVSHDITNSYRCLIENDEEELLAIYHDLYSEEEFIDYLAKRINSQSDGGMGLKQFRNDMIQKLCENISEEEIELSLQEVQKQFNLSDLLADEPIYHVKFHYFLYPDVDPSDERSTDLNEEGIKAFLSIINQSE